MKRKATVNNVINYLISDTWSKKSIDHIHLLKSSICEYLWKLLSLLKKRLTYKLESWSYQFFFVVTLLLWGLRNKYPISNSCFCKIYKNITYIVMNTNLSGILELFAVVYSVIYFRNYTLHGVGITCDCLEMCFKQEHHYCYYKINNSSNMDIQ